MDAKSLMWRRANFHFIGRERSAWTLQLSDHVVVCTGPIPPWLLWCYERRVRQDNIVFCENGLLWPLEATEKQLGDIYQATLVLHCVLFFFLAELIGATMSKGFVA